MEASNDCLAVTRTYSLPNGGTVTVTASGEGVENLAILRPEVALAMAERLLGVAATIRGTNDSVHNVE